MPDAYAVLYTSFVCCVLSKYLTLNYAQLREIEDVRSTGVMLLLYAPRSHRRSTFHCAKYVPYLRRERVRITHSLVKRQVRTRYIYVYSYSVCMSYAVAAAASCRCSFTFLHSLSTFHQSSSNHPTASARVGRARVLCFVFSVRRQRVFVFCAPRVCCGVCI